MDLDGKVTVDDYLEFLHYYTSPPAAADLTWMTGDFNYDGKINVNDYLTFLTGYRDQGAPLAAETAEAAAAPATSGVPLAASPPVPTEQHTGGQAASGTGVSGTLNTPAEAAATILASQLRQSGGLPAPATEAAASVAPPDDGPSRLTVRSAAPASAAAETTVLAISPAPQGRNLLRL